jgi:3-phosphoshikimate 1-carboxyvinyltransferase
LPHADSEGGALDALTSASTGVLSIAAVGALSGTALGTIPELDLPLSKSVWNRLQVLRAVVPDRVDLSKWPEVGVSFDSGVTESDTSNETAGAPEDVLAMARAVEAVRRSCATDTWQQVDVGPAGTAWRFGLALALASPGAKVVLEGHARLQERPIEPLVKALRSLGAELEGGVPPHRCTGRRLRGGPCTLYASASSQHLSALLLIAPLLEEPLTIHLTAPLVSAPYAHMTAALLRRVGYSVSIDDATWRVHPFSNSNAGPLPKLVVFDRDPDWSAAAVHGAVAALTGKPALLRDLRLDSLQGDRAVGALLANLGVRMESVPGGILVDAPQRGAAVTTNTLIHPENGNNTGPLAWDFSEIPDTAQPLLAAAMALGRSGKAVGLHTLAGKEINRMNGLLELAEVLGVSCSADADTFSFSPGPNFGQHERLSGPGSSQHRSAQGDHRQAFAWALVGLRVPVSVSDPDCVRKSYPDFWRNFSVHVGA